LCEPWHGIDHAEHPEPGGLPAQIAQLALEARQHVERREPRGDVSLLDGHLTTQLAKRPRDRAIGPQRAVTGDICAIAAHTDPLKGQAHTLRQFDRLWQLQSHFLQTSLDVHFSQVSLRLAVVVVSRLSLL